MASANNERCRKKAVRCGERNVQVTSHQDATDPGAGTIPTPAVCNVVNSINLPISSVPVLLNPTNNIQVWTTPQLNPVIRFGEFEENLKTYVKELQKAELDFLEEVSKINATDRLIFENASYLECLHLHLKEQSITSKNVDTDVQKSFTELNVLEETVSNLERRVDGEINHHLLNCLDEKRRENLYNFLIQLDSNMNYLVAQLSEVICLNNSPQSGSCHQTNPVQQIGCVLNHNFDTLLHLENAILESKIRVERILNLQKEIQNNSIKKKCT